MTNPKISKRVSASFANQVLFENCHSLLKQVESFRFYSLKALGSNGEIPRHGWWQEQRNLRGEVQMMVRGGSSQDL